MFGTSPRQYFRSALGVTLGFFLLAPVFDAPGPPEPVVAGIEKAAETYETHVKGIRIFPGQWRPHYPFEQIVWISPSWPSQEYLWLDFPEAIFSNQGLLYLSHVNPAFPVLFPDLPKADWRGIPGGLEFDRKLPNGIAFGGRVTKKNSSAVDLELHIFNGSGQPLTGIKLQTCAFLRACREFSDFTMDNKLVHLPGEGWKAFPEAMAAAKKAGRYRLGWRGGRALADLPIIACRSNRAERLVAMTWGEHTLSLIGNPSHPCMHADPQFKDLQPGESASIRGEIIFFEGTIEQFEAFLAQKK